MEVKKLGIVSSPLLGGFVRLFSLPGTKNNRNWARQQNSYRPLCNHCHFMGYNTHARTHTHTHSMKWNNGAILCNTSKTRNNILLLLQNITAKSF